MQHNNKINQRNEDFSFGVENEYLKYLITEIDDINVELGSNEINSQFEDIDNLYSVLKELLEHYKSKKDIIIDIDFDPKSL